MGICKVERGMEHNIGTTVGLGSYGLGLRIASGYLQHAGFRSNKNAL